MKGFDRKGMAARVAQDIPEGWHVNLGIGIPTMVADYIPMDREVLVHSENGILGMGPAPAPDKVNPWLVNAGKQAVTLRAGGSYFHPPDSLAVIPGGHIDPRGLRALRGAGDGTSENDTAPAVGGAMDLAAGAKNLWVVMEHTTKDGRPKLVRECGYPLTAPRAVTRVYTNLAVVDVVKGRGFVVVDMAPGVTFDALQAVTDAKLHLPA